MNVALVAVYVIWLVVVIGYMHLCDKLWKEVKAQDITIDALRSSLRRVYKENRLAYDECGKLMIQRNEDYRTIAALKSVNEELAAESAGWMHLAVSEIGDMLDDLWEKAENGKRKKPKQSNPVQTKKRAAKGAARRTTRK